MWTENKIFKEDLEYITSAGFIDWQKLDNKAVFVTGATGLIGYTFVSALLYRNLTYNSNIKIIALVRNISKAKEKFAEQNMDLIDMIDKAQNTIPKADGQKMTSVFSSARDRAEKLEEKLNNHTEYSKVIAGANIVSKVYPSTTHAKTIEYAVADEKELDTFHATIIRDISKYDSESKEALDSNPKIGGRLYIFKKDEEKK